MHELLIDLLQSLGRPRIFVVGDLMLDRYVWGNADRISPEAPIPVLRVTHCEDRLGGAAAVAGILRGLNAQVTLAGVLGVDAAADLCRGMLDRFGVDSSLVLKEAQQPTTLKQRFIGKAEQRHPQQVLRVDHEATAPISDELLERTLAGVKPLIPEHDAVLISDYAKGFCHPALIRMLVQECRLHSMPVVIDPGCKSDWQHYRGASTLTPNRREAGIALGQTIGAIDTALRGAAQLREAFNLDVGLITLDRDGMVLAPRHGEGVHFPVRPRQVYDITGAGDVTLAVLGLALACDVDYPNAIRLANIAAGISVESIGVQPVTRLQIINDLIRTVSHDGVFPKELLVHQLQLHRDLSRKIVFTNGCFDILHTGHIHLLHEARRLGDILVVGLNSDASVRRLGKSSGRPINDERARARVLSALKCVDYVCLFAEDTPWELIQAVKPDVLVKGADYRPEQVVGKDFVESYGGRLHLVALQPDQSTTGTIARIKGV